MGSEQKDYSQQHFSIFRGCFPRDSLNLSSDLSRLMMILCWKVMTIFFSLQSKKNITYVTIFLLLHFSKWQAISLTVIEKVQIAAAILGSLFLIASISWLVWSSLSPSAKWQRQDLLFQICYGMYGFMDVVCIGEYLSLCCSHITSLQVQIKYNSGLCNKTSYGY